MSVAMTPEQVVQFRMPPLFLQRIGSRIEKLQMLPAVAQQALEVMRDPDCTIREFARLIEQDLKLATEMLRMANSSVYSNGRTVATLSEAALRLGLQQCRNLILTTSFASLIEGLSLEEEWVRDLLWRHGLVTAVISRTLNRSLKAGFQGEEFTAGLVHDFGRILLGMALPERFLEGDPVDFNERGNLMAREREIFETDHAEVGAWFADRNRLPACLVAAIRFHHEPQAAGPHLRLAALVSAADHMANYVQFHESAAGYDPFSNPAIPLLEADGLQEACERFQTQAGTILEDSCQAALELCGA